MTRFGLIAVLRIVIAASGARCALRRLLSCCVWASIRWLAELFDVDFHANSTTVDWARLLEHVAERLHGDMEPEFLAEFPWSLMHLSVLVVCGTVIGSLRLCGRGASLL